MGNQVVIAVGTFILLLTGLLLGYVLSQLVLGFLAFNLLTFFGTLSLILIFGTLYYVLFWQLRREQSRPSTIDEEIPNQVDEGRSDGYLKNRIIAKLSGNTAAAERRIEQARETYPGKTENWYCEKVLEDLELEDLKREDR